MNRPTPDWGGEKKIKMLNSDLNQSITFTMTAASGNFRKPFIDVTRDFLKFVLTLLHSLYKRPFLSWSFTSSWFSGSPLKSPGCALQRVNEIRFQRHRNKGIRMRCIWLKIWENGDYAAHHVTLISVYIINVIRFSFPFSGHFGNFILFEKR
jgi:hypothetical protein